MTSSHHIKPNPELAASAPLLVVLLLSATAQGAAGQSQAFRERPDSVQVRAGSDVFLRCAVDHQQGKAQWTKDGFALGFERNVPGYPRYQYSGEAALGEHHLIIKGITLEDDGEYQCQVGPTANALPIWAAANVTVMVPPGSIKVAGRREGEVVVVTEGEEVQLECVVGDARPEPSLTWYRAGLRVDPELQTDVRKPSTRRRLVSVTSRLTVKATRTDDGKQYTCRASHPALQHPALPLAASLTLSVLHPPDPPIITGYRTGEVLRAGERRTLTCRVVGGNPGPWVTWYWHQVMPNNTVRTQARKSVHLNEKTNSGLRSRGVSVTQQVTASRTDDGAVYECRVTSDELSRPLSSNVTLTVHYAPAQVRVTGPTVVTAGQRYTLTCLTSPANPPATLTWILDDDQVNTTTTAVTRDDGGGWVTSSELSSKAGRASSVRMARARCEAQHLEATSTLTHTRNVTIMRPPGQPVVELNAKGQVVAGNLVEFTCITKGGHPPPKVRLYKSDKELTAQTAVRSGVTKVTATLTAAPEDNGARLRCEATNAALPAPLTALTTLNLLFPAWEVRGWANPRSVEVGHVVTLTCESSASVPPSTITWHSSANALAKPSSRQSPGSFGGTVTRSEMRVRVRAEDQGCVVTCEADNGLEVTVATNITLNVLHAPVWVEAPRGRLDVVEGDNLTIIAKAQANPGPVKYKWRRGREEVGNGTAGEGALRVGPLHRLHSHNYTVTASSPRGTISSNFYLNVQYGPESVETERRVNVGRNRSATVRCSATGNPTPTVTWTKKDSNVTRGVLAEGLGEAHLVVKLASPADTGVYLCRASSPVATAPPVSSTVVVEQAPWWSNSQPGEVVSSSWAPLGGSGRLECHMKAHPPPTFHWATRDGRTITSSRKHTFLPSKLVDGVVEWSSTLEVRSVTPEDYAIYTCTATNALGKHTSTLALTPPVPPATPRHLAVANVSTGEVLLVWRPDLSRSTPAGYLLSMWRGDETAVQVLNVSGSERTSMLVGDLSPGTLYSFTVQAFNPQGLSRPSVPPLTVTTLGVAESASSSSSGGGGEGGSASGSRVPRLILLIMTLAGTALLALNIAIIACFVRRRAAHNNRGVSASSSKTTTLEVFSPATTPGTTQGDELPITSTKGLTAITRQCVEGQPGLGETEQTSLFHGNDHGGPLAPPLDPNVAANVARAGYRNGNRSHQNGGLYLQKYREDTPYYYSPLPQNHSLPAEEGVMARPGNPPDVCPTTSDSRGTLTRRSQRSHPDGQNQRQQQQAPEQQQQKQQLKQQHRQQVSDMYPMEPLSAPTGGYFHAVTDNPRRHSVDEKRRPGSQPSHLHHYHHHHPEQQLAQNRGSPRTAEGHDGSRRQHHLHNLDQFNAYSQNHREITATTAGVAGSYATLGPRRVQHQQQQQAAPQFSTLQRPISKATPGLHNGHREHHHHHDQRTSEGADGTGATQDDSGSSGYGGSPRQEVGGTSSGGAGALACPQPADAASSAATTSTLSRTRSSSDHSKKGKGDLPEPREGVGQGKPG